VLSKFPPVLREEAKRFDQVLIDEYQDTNRSQYQIIRALASGHRNLCVVGDDDQSIYGWRGAEVTHILRFAKDWPEAKIVRLEDNYRSTEAILGYANTLIAFNRDRHKKVLKAAKTGGTRPTIMQCQDETQEGERGRRSCGAGTRRRRRSGWLAIFAVCWMLPMVRRCSRARLRYCAARTSS